MDKFDSIMSNENDLPNGSFGSAAETQRMYGLAAAMRSLEAVAQTRVTNL